MKVTTQIEEARNQHAAAIEQMDDQDAKIQALPDDTPDEERKFHLALFEKRQEEAERWAETLERLVAIQRAKGLVPGDKTDEAAAEQRERVEIVNDPVYKPNGTQSFFRDVISASRNADAIAGERLARNDKLTKAELEKRDISTASTAGGGFVPPVYMGDYYAAFARESRPFANTVPTSPLASSGMAITVPRITTGTTVIVSQTENSTAPAETNIVDSNLTVSVRTIAGMQDVSQQLFDRSDPGIDQIVFNDLRAAYDMYLDTQLLAGTGSNGQHLGIRAVTSPNTTSYTTATPTAAGLTPKLYDAIQKVATNRHADPEVVVMHPRRAAWLASNLSSTFPLFQVGALNQAVGSQNIGQIINVSGLQVVSDSNISTIYSEGGNTDEDEIYVVRTSDMHLWEGPVQVRVYPEVGSGTLTVRLLLFAYSAFASDRYGKSVSIVKGSGLAAPTF